MIRVMIAEDMEPIRSRYTRILNADPEIEVVCSTNNGVDAVTLAVEHKPDVVLMDIEMESRKAGLVATQKIMEHNPDAIILILTVYDHDELLFTSFQLGAKDYLLKTSDPEQVIQSMKSAYQGLPTLRLETEEKLHNEFRRSREHEKSLLYMINIITTLTGTEIDLLLDMHKGLSRQAICARRFIEMSTLRTHIHNILKKFEEPNIAQVVAHLDSLSLFDMLEHYTVGTGDGRR